MNSSLLRIVFVGSSVAASAAIIACGGSFTVAGDAGAADASVVDGEAGDGAATDGSPSRDGGGARSDGGGLGVDAGSCAADAAIFDNVIKGCASDLACVAVDHQVDCCGSLVAVGINHASQMTFDQDESTWRASCPGCGCSPQPTVGEDGKPCGPNGCVVTCDLGKCRTSGL